MPHHHPVPSPQEKLATRVLQVISVTEKKICFFFSFTNNGPGLLKNKQETVLFIVPAGLAPIFRISSKAFYAYNQHWYIIVDSYQGPSALHP